MAPNPPLTSFEKLKLRLKSLSSILVVLQYLALYPFFRGPKPPLKTVIKNAATRHVLGLVTNREIQHIMPPSLTVYKSWTRKKSIPTNIEEVSIDGTTARLLWLGPRTSRKVLYYIHGGGFELPIQSGHLEFVAWIRRELGDDDIAVALLVYTTTPEKQYPAQFREAVVGLKSLIDRGISPSNIIVAGDSAGGHITLSIISHILHTHPSVPALTIAEPFAATLCVSPCVTMDSRCESLSSCAKYDMISPYLVRTRWNSMLMSGSSFQAEKDGGGHWGAALDAPESWWVGIDRVTRKLGVSVGGCEIFRDDVVAFVDAVKRGGHAVEFVLAETEAHDEPLNEGMRVHGEGVRMEDVVGESSKAFLQWSGEAFGLRSRNDYRPVRQHARRGSKL